MSKKKKKERPTKGYVWNKQKGKFLAYLKIHGSVIKHLGYFTTKTQARQAYEEGCRKYGIPK